MSSSPTEKRVEVQMPQMGVSVADGTLLEWRKRAGDWVEADETIADVTTDKVDVEIPAPASGRLARLIVEPGETVAVGAPLAEIDTGARPGEAHPEEHPEGGEEERDATASGVGKPIAPATTRPSSGGSPTSTASICRNVEGTGVGGRVRKRDLLAFIERRGRAARRRSHAEPVGASHRVAVQAS